MKNQPFISTHKNKYRFISMFIALIVVAVVANMFRIGGHTTQVAQAATNAITRGGGLGQSSGLLPASHLTEESAIQVDLSKETVRLPLYSCASTTRTSYYAN